MPGESKSAFLNVLKYWKRYVTFMWRQSRIENWQRKFLTTEVGHYYSPFPNLPSVSDNIRKTAAENEPKKIRGIDLSLKRHEEFLSSSGSFIKNIVIPKEREQGFLYHSDNSYFNIEDALAYCAVLHLNRPKKIIEVGSGYSSALAIDYSRKWREGEIEFTFIEPYPARLREVLNGYSENINILETQVQNVNLDSFEVLQKNDVLFIDSSHVSKCGSDVNYLFFEVIPRLNPGVLVHVHDIFWPFDYPLVWLQEGRCWNEAYLLRGLLIDNPKLEVEFFASMAENYMQKEVLEYWGRKYGEKSENRISNSSSIWLRVK